MIQPIILTMKKILCLKTIVTLTVSFLCLNSFAQSTPVLEDSTNINGQLNTPLSKGYVIKTSSNHFYEITDKVAQRVRITDAQVNVYHDGKKYKLVIRGIDKMLACNKLDGVIESYIDGDFKGYDGTTTFKLANLQVWQQDSPGIIYTNLYKPVVYIYRTSEGYKMKIFGVDDDPIIVKKK